MSDFFQNTDKFFRQVHKGLLSKGQVTPSAFRVRDTEEGLSVDLERIIEKPENSLIIIGKTYKTTKDNDGSKGFKDPSEFDLYKIDYSFIKLLEHIKEVVYKPVNNTPEQTGRPNNLSHCEIINTNDDEVRVKLKDHAKRIEDLDRESVKIALDQYYAQLSA